MKIIKIGAMWCPACLIVNKHINKLKTKYADIQIVEYDYDLDSEDIKFYNVGDILPVLILTNNDGKELTRLIGESSYDDIEKAVIKYENN